MTATVFRTDPGSGQPWLTMKDNAGTPNNMELVGLNFGGDTAAPDIATSEALSDTLSRTAKRLVMGGAVLLDNGTNLVRGRGDATGGAWVQGPAAHDAAVAGNPVLLGAHGDTDGDVSAVSADGDAVKLLADLKGRLFVRPLPVTTGITVASGGLTTATTAYAIGDQVGTMFAFAGAARVSGGTGVVRSISVEDKADVTSSLTLVFCRSNITLAADNAAFAISDADGQDVLGYFTVGMTDLGNNRFATLQPYMAFDCAATTLYVAVQTNAAHTFFGAVSDIRIYLNITQD